MSLRDATREVENVRYKAGAAVVGLFGERTLAWAVFLAFTRGVIVPGHTRLYAAISSGSLSQESPYRRSQRAHSVWNWLSFISDSSSIT